MARTTPANQQSRSKTKTSKSKPTTQTQEHLEEIRNAAKKDYRHAKKTDQQYDGTIARGHAFLSTLVAGKKTGFQDIGSDTTADLEALARAFNKIPNHYSATALELFIVQKCLTEGKGESTAVSIHAAFARQWDQACVLPFHSMSSIQFWFHSSGDKYRGPYSLDEGTNKVSGNPARSAMIQDLLKTIKNKCGAEGDARNHAKAMTIEDMETLMNWSEGCVPNRMADHEFTDAASLANAAKHFFMRAFMTSGFTLWTRFVFLVCWGGLHWMLKAKWTGISNCANCNGRI
jgi:hypothetical protein